MPIASAISRSRSRPTWRSTTASRWRFGRSDTSTHNSTSGGGTASMRLVRASRSSNARRRSFRRATLNATWNNHPRMTPRPELDPSARTHAPRPRRQHPGQASGRRTRGTAPCPVGVQLRVPGGKCLVRLDARSISAHSDREVTRRRKCIVPERGGSRGPARAASGFAFTPTPSGNARCVRTRAPPAARAHRSGGRRCLPHPQHRQWPPGCGLPSRQLVRSVAICRA